MKKNGMTLPPKKQNVSNSTGGETKTTTTTKTYMYLSTRLFVPYLITASGEIKPPPEHIIAWWINIFSYIVPDDKDRKLRFLCRLFRDALKPPPLMWTSFPHPKYPKLNNLMNRVYKADPSKAPKSRVCYYYGRYTFQSYRRVIIKYPMKMIGAFIFFYSRRYSFALFHRAIAIAL